MKCPHCLVEFHDSPQITELAKDKEGNWWVVRRTCPSCSRLVLHLVNGTLSTRGNYVIHNPTTEQLIRPKSCSRTALSPEVPPDISQDYNEACLVLSDSPKASAALSRRCLQHLLRKYAKVKPSDLGKEIQEVLDSKSLPTYLSEPLDAIRNIGNFAAHPLKSTSSGEIIDVDSGEAEWNLDVLEMFFDFYFVQPSITKAKRDALNKKLKDAGKPEMK